MKYLVLLLVIVVVGWLTIGRRRRPPDGGKAPPGPASRHGAEAARPQAMLVCVHCGVHLPRADAVQDSAGRNFCSEAHRLAGPPA